MSGSKPLRFASLIRVSSEKQERKGESLNIQRQDHKRDVQRLEGTTVGEYGGQEHATPGWERKELDRLLSDATKGKFDAIHVQTPDRWSRDNANSKKGLQVLRDHGIRFFVGTTEYDLHDPQAILFLGMSAEIGEFVARQQAKKSLATKIERARQNRPACGKLPHGRTFNKATGEWDIDKQKQAVIIEVANRYLAGENLKRLAKEKGVNASHLHKVLNHLSGSTWVQTFVSKSLNVNAEIVTKVPPLLDEATIKAIRERARANRTYGFGQQKYKQRYLLGRMVMCAECGYAMHGQYVNRDGHRYYRHNAEAHGRGCKHAGAWVRADRLEDSVFGVLFATFGNAVAVQRAIEAATPNADKVAEARLRITDIEAELAKVTKGRDRMMDFIIEESITREQADRKLAELQERETLLNKELSTHKDAIEHIPTPEQVKATAERATKAFNKGRGWALEEIARSEVSEAEGVTWDDRRALCQLVFGGRDRQGGRLGVCVRREGRGDYRFRVKGLLLDDWENQWRLAEEGLEGVPMFGSEKGRKGQKRQKALLNAVGDSLSSAPRTPTAPGCTAIRAGSAPAITANTSRATTRTRRRRVSTTGSTSGVRSC